MLLSNTCANHAWSLWVFYTEMSSQPPLSGCTRSLPAAMLFAANMAAMCARAEWSATHHVSAPILASMRACMNDSSLCVRACVCVCPTSPACCLIASSLTQPTRRASMQCNTLVLYLSSGLEHVCCQTRVIRWYDSVIQLQTYCDFVLVFSACSEWSLIKWWSGKMCRDLLTPFSKTD